MKRFWLFWTYLFSGFAFIISGADAEDSNTNEPPIQLEEVAVTATRLEKDTFRTPNAITVVDRRQMERMNADITPNLLREAAGVFSQSTTVGQGSPHLRGLTGYQTYMQVDGVRLNNSTFRSGPNQYFATIAPDSINRIEVLRGPGSVLYGTGAMGGVISVFTKEPAFGTSQKWEFHPRLFGRYASATTERMGRLEVSGSHERLGFLLGASARGFGDLNPGKGYDLHYKNRKFEIMTEKPEGVPLFEEPPKAVPDKWLIDTETPLDWKAYDGDAKIAYQLSDKSSIQLAYQLWRQMDVPRYDKIAPREFDVFFFDPQDRDLVYASYIAKQMGSAVDQLRFTASFHRQRSGEREVQLGKTEQRERLDTVNTFGVSAQGTNTSLPRQRIVVGGDFYSDTLDSQTTKTDLKTGSETTDDKQGNFIDGSQFWDANFFIQDEIELHKQVELTLGGRFTLYGTDADLTVRDKSFGKFSESDQALTGSAGVVVGLTDGLNLVGNFATSFRAPTLNDTTAVTVTNQGVDAPSPDLKSETGWTVEGGFKARYPQFSGSVILFHSRINDLVTRVPVKEAYKDQPLPKLYQDIQAAYPKLDINIFDNLDEAQIQGIEVAGLFPVVSGLSIYGNGMFTRGKVLLINGKVPDATKPWEEHIRREPPLNGILGVRWERPSDRFWGECFVRGAARQDRLNRDDIRDPRIPGKTRDIKDPKKPDSKGVEFDEDGRAIDAGSPGWVTLNIRGGVRLTEYNRLNLALENILDKRYREHGSGIDAPGLNLIVSLDNRF
ncbi:TonB-dependent receptor [Candidatus Poribacteria bacterium]|nr:TonB-dependent receptor [Candidatus Poribacteria bacterium]